MTADDRHGDTPASSPVRLEPRSDRFDPAHPLYSAVVAAHGEAMANGIAQYIDPVSGYRVFTAGALADRGWCCESGCRHCPY